MTRIFQKQDRIKVICGKDKGKVSNIIRILSSKNKVVVRDVNIVKKSFKPSKKNPDGDIKKIEMPIDISNIMHCINDKGDVSRIGLRVDKGKKIRFYKKTGEAINIKKDESWK